ncbi:CvpA family protein [Velocimicrobium porci]|uniref:CvpA family protein n=1 Tax=Velocimicrobium porci TaxID=2606634 RepID=A0A6L5XWY1_9FIRM|nr:CvpA family protein [Velocimicrobium porci]MSS63350.1 CvpA family protein [Velocimicrobium porci]
MKKKAKWILIPLICLLIIGAVSYYIYLPAVNIHSVDFWFFIFAILVVTTFLTFLFGNRNRTEKIIGSARKEEIPAQIHSNKLFRASAIITLIFIVVFIVGSLLSSPIINAKKYRELIQLKERNFSEDIEQISYNEIPLLDKDSAALLGSRKMGSMMEYVSQFEVADNYAQINLNDKPARVTPLKYANLLKWFTNRSKGLPAYIKIDMTTQNAECVKLSEGIKYSESEHFSRYIYRYLRFHFPTYIFDTINFEIDENGTPYWICPVKDYTIGLFGGQTIKNVVIVNAVNGEIANYKIDEVPSWVDRVYSAELLTSYYNYYGTLKHGFLNSVLSQKDCLQTTEGYNYIALEDDVWVYTGVTSVVSDESLVGFVLMNQRTAETRYYSVAGAKEYSAMASAEGKVQNLSYTATFPLLLNISNEPTYFIALKDSAGLVKKYAMVNIEQYTIVAIGDTITECEKDYKNQLRSNHVTVQGESGNEKKASGTIETIAPCVIDGTTHYYVILKGQKPIYDIDISNHVEIVRFHEGDFISFTYSEGTDTNSVIDLK